MGSSTKRKTMACVCCTTNQQLQEKSAMVKKYSIVSLSKLKGLLEGEQDALNKIVRTVI